MTILTTTTKNQYAETEESKRASCFNFHIVRGNVHVHHGIVMYIVPIYPYEFNNKSLLDVCSIVVDNRHTNCALPCSCYSLICIIFIDGVFFLFLEWQIISISQPLCVLCTILVHCRVNAAPTYVN